MDFDDIIMQTVRILENFEEPKIIFDLYPDLMNVSAKVKKAHEAGKKYFLHMDLAKGVGKDESGM